MRISDWSSDVCSSDLNQGGPARRNRRARSAARPRETVAPPCRTGRSAIARRTPTPPSGRSAPSPSALPPPETPAREPETGGEQQDRRRPERPRNRLQRRRIANTIAAAFDQPVPYRVRTLTRADALPPEGAPVARRPGRPGGHRRAMAEARAPRPNTQ